MAHLVQTRVFPRPSHAQDGWLFTAATPTVFDAALWPGIEQLTRSFLSLDKPRIRLTDARPPDFGWIGGMPVQFDPALWAAIEQLKSGLPYELRRFDLLRQSFHDLGWITANVPAFNAALWPAIAQLVSGLPPRQRDHFFAWLTGANAGTEFVPPDTFGGGIWRPTFRPRRR